MLLFAGGEECKNDESSVGSQQQRKMLNKWRGRYPAGCVVFSQNKPPSVPCHVGSPVVVVVVVVVVV